MNDAGSILSDLVGRDHTPSVHYIVFDKDRVIYQFHSGLADIKSNRNTGDRTSYHFFSITKTFTALAIMQLAEKKLIHLDQPASDYLSTFPYSKEITIRQLLTHSAGIPNPLPLNWIHLEEEHTDFDSDKFFSVIFAKYNKVKSGPNKKFSYSNLGYVLLGNIIENVTGKPYEKYITENIINRLGLPAGNLGFELSAFPEPATGYHKKASISYLLLGLLMDKKKFMYGPEGKWAPFRKFYINGIPYGGLIGTPLSLARYGQELLKPGSALVTDDYKKLLFSENLTTAGERTGMCLSWFTGSFNGEQYYAHAGGGGGYYCELRIYPGHGKGSVIMFNRTGMTDERFLDKVDRYLIN